MAKHYDFWNVSAVEGFPPNIFVIADSADEANSKAEDAGIYFDGVASGRDCPCCGDSWHRVDESDVVSDE